MNTIVTICPICTTPQLVYSNSLGKNAQCATCGATFTCRKLYGPIHWAQKVSDSEIHPGSFSKRVTKVLFNYGLAIPVQYRDLYLEHLDTPLKIGESKKVSIAIDDKKYTVSLVHFTNRRGIPRLHLKWPKQGVFYQALRVAMPESYSHFIAKTNTINVVQQTVLIALSDQKNEFVMKINPLNDKSAALDDAFDW